MCWYTAQFLGVNKAINTSEMRVDCLLDHVAKRHWYYLHLICILHFAYEGLEFSYNSSVSPQGVHSVKVSHLDIVGTEQQRENRLGLQFSVSKVLVLSLKFLLLCWWNE